MTLLVRTLAILGLGLTAALVHSWAGPEIRLEPDSTVEPGRELSPRGADSRDAESSQEASEAGNGSASDARTESDDDDTTGSGAGDREATPDAAGSQGRSSDSGDKDAGEDNGADGADDPPAQMDPRDFPPQISLEQAEFLYQYIESGDVVFIDARGIRERYLEGHIRGAINLDTDDIAQGTPVFRDFQFNPKNVWAVIYCSGGDCDESKHVKIDLADYGYRSTFIFEGGYPAWEQAGLPTATGPDPWGGGE